MNMEAFDPTRTIKFPMRCDLCGGINDATRVAVQSGTLPNAFNLPDHNHPHWQCVHCQGWNYSGGAMPIIP